MCALGAAGVLSAEGAPAAGPTTTASTLVSAAGIRAFVELPLGAPGALRLGGDVLGTLGGARLVVDGREAWAMAPFHGLFYVAGMLNVR